MDHGGDIDIILPVLRAWAVVSDAEFERVAAALKTISNVMKIQGET